MVALLAVTLFAPSLGEAADAARSFLEAAGREAPALSPRAMGAELRRSFSFDPLDAEGAARCGADRASPASWDTRAAVATFGVRDRTAARACLDAWLSVRKGVRAQGPRRGVETVLLARSKGSRPYAGYALARDRAWVYLGGARDGGAALEEAVRRGRPRPPRPPAKDGAPMLLQAGEIRAAVFLSAEGLTARGRAPARAGPSPIGAAEGALAWAAGDLLGLVRVEDAFAWVLGRARPAAAAPAPGEIARDLAVDGSAAVLLAGLDLRAPLPPPAGVGDAVGPFFLFRHAYLARSGDPGKARRFIESLGDMEISGRPVYAGVEGPLVFLASDLAARDAALAAAHGPASDLPALVGRAEPRRLAAALDRLTVLSAARSDTLLGLYAAKLQLLPLLSAAGAAELSGERKGNELHFTLRVPLGRP